MDGILLSGGSDLDPRRYGDETRHPTTYGINAERDGFEFALAHMARARDLPHLGVCRGIQSLNVAFGGTLFQDIDGQLASAINHRPSSGPATLAMTRATTWRSTPPTVPCATFSAPTRSR